MEEKIMEKLTDCLKSYKTWNTHEKEALEKGDFMLLKNSFEVKNRLYGELCSLFSLLPDGEEKWKIFE